MQIPIEASGQITRRDYIRFVHLGLRKRLLIPGILYLLAVLYITFWIGMEIGSDSGHDWKAVVARQDGYTLWVYLFPLMTYLFILAVSCSVYAGDKLIQKKRSYRLDEKGLSCTDENSNAFVPWEEVMQYAESTHLFAVYVTTRKAYPLPKRFFSAGELGQIHDLLKTKVKPGKKWKISKIQMLVFVVLLFGATWILLDFADRHENNAKAFVQEAHQKIESKDYPGALVLLNQAIQEDPQLAIAYVHRGYVKGMLQNKVGALEDCSKAVLLDTTNCNAYLQLGYARIVLRDTAGACEAFHQAERKRDKDAGAMIKKYCR